MRTRFSFVSNSLSFSRSLLVLTLQHIATNCNTLQHTAVLDGLLPEGHSTFHNNPHFLNGTAGGNFGRVCICVHVHM